MRKVRKSYLYIILNYFQEAGQTGPISQNKPGEFWSEQIQTAMFWTVAAGTFWGIALISLLFILLVGVGLAWGWRLQQCRFSALKCIATLFFSRPLGDVFKFFHLKHLLGPHLSSAASSALRSCSSPRNLSQQPRNHHFPRFFACKEAKHFLLWFLSVFSSRLALVSNFAGLCSLRSRWVNFLQLSERCGITGFVRESASCF